MRCDVVIVRYGEVALKSKGVRREYERILTDNLRAKLDCEGVDYQNIKREWGRIYITTTEPEVADVVSNVFGVVSASPSVVCSPDINEIVKVLVEVANELLSPGMSFGIRAKRVGGHDFTSRDICVRGGDAILSEVEGVVVNLDSPDVELVVEVRQNSAYIYTKVVEGVGGLPVGTQGKMVSLVSGGMDSPVATWLMMKRGAEIVALHLDTSPSDVKRQMEVISRWAPNHPIRFYNVPFAFILDELVRLGTKLTCVLCKRMMYRIAKRVMKIEGCDGVITGSSLGQVASQTSRNLMVETIGLDIPLYHPLIAMDKTEVM